MSQLDPEWIDRVGTPHGWIRLEEVPGDPCQRLDLRPLGEWVVDQSPLDPMKYVDRLDPEDGEILFLRRHLGLRQDQIGRLIGLNQASVCYRLGRLVGKVAYLYLLDRFDVPAVLARLEFLGESERAALVDLANSLDLTLARRAHDLSMKRMKQALASAREGTEDRAARDPSWEEPRRLVEVVQVAMDHHLGPILTRKDHTARRFRNEVQAAAPAPSLKVG